MSELFDYITDFLENEYEKDSVLSKTATNELTVYRHKKSGKKLVFIRSGYRNDEVFRRLKGLDTGGYTPIIYEVAGEEDYLYILEEFVEGHPLADCLKEGETLSQQTVIGYLTDVCSSLEIIHQLGIVHRDIKPENILIRDGKACLIDFSIAKIIRPGKDTVNLGTVGYAAPEQYGVSGCMPTTDIYALGVLANILLTGEHPTSQIPSGKLGKIIKKCTDIQINKRYQTAAELKRALQKCS